MINKVISCHQINEGYNLFVGEVQLAQSLSLWSCSLSVAVRETRGIFMGSPAPVEWASWRWRPGGKVVLQNS